MAGSDCEGLSWILLEEVCGNVIYKIYIYIYIDHADDQNMFLTYIWSLCIVPGSQLQNPVEFPKC